MGRHSELDLTSKRLLYDYCTHWIQLWGCASKSNIEIIQRRKNIVFRAIVADYRYESNDIVRRGTMIASALDEITKFVRKHETKHHANPAAIQLLENSQNIRGLNAQDDMT